MNIDHTLALIIIYGMIILLILAIIWFGFMIAIVFGVRRLLRSAELAQARLTKLIDHPGDLIMHLITRVSRRVTGNVSSNMSKWWKRSKK